MNDELLNKIDDYLTERMPEEERDVFEELLLTDEALQRTVREQIALREGMKAESALLLSEPPLSLVERLHRLLVSPTWAYAATAGLLLAVAAGITGMQDNAVMLGEVAVVRNVELTRSDKESVIAAPEGQVVLLSIDAYGLETQEAGIRITRGNETLADLPSVKADEQALFNIVVGPFESGDYRIEVLRQDAEPFVAKLVVR